MPHELLNPDIRGGVPALQDKSDDELLEVVRNRQVKNQDRPIVAQVMDANPHLTYDEVRRKTDLHVTDRTLQNWLKAYREGKYSEAPLNSSHIDTGQPSTVPGTHFEEVHAVVRARETLSIGAE